MKRDKQSFGEYLEALLCKRNYPGMAVCIRGPEGVLFDRGFGYRSIEHHKKADTNTIYGIASMSKSMTALACCSVRKLCGGSRGRRHGNDLSRLKRRHRISIADTENRRAAIYDRGFGHVQLWCGRQSCDRRPPL